MYALNSFNYGTWLGKLWNMVR